MGGYTDRKIYRILEEARERIGVKQVQRTLDKTLETLVGRPDEGYTQSETTQNEAQEAVARVYELLLRVVEENSEGYGFYDAGMGRAIKGLTIDAYDPIIATGGQGAVLRGTLDLNNMTTEGWRYIRRSQKPWEYAEEAVADKEITQKQILDKLPGFVRRAESEEASFYRLSKSDLVREVRSRWKELGVFGRKTKPKVAIKVSWTNGNKRSRREYRLAGMPGDGTVNTLWYGHSRARIPYMVQEEIEGHIPFLAYSQMLSERQKLVATKKLLEEIGRFSKMGGVHRDIKPENVFITPTVERVIKRHWGFFSKEMNLDSVDFKLGDFGMYKFWSEDKSKHSLQTRDNTLLGTPSYQSPEHAENSTLVDVRGDMWAAGAVLHYMLTDKTMHHNLPDDKKHWKGVWANTIAGLQHKPDLPNVSPPIQLVLAGLLQPKAHRRLQTPEQAVKDLESALQGKMPAHSMAHLKQEGHRAYFEAVYGTAPDWSMGKGKIALGTAAGVGALAAGSYALRGKVQAFDDFWTYISDLF